jgi:fructose-1,6-bisphosphatase
MSVVFASFRNKFSRKSENEHFSFNPSLDVLYLLGRNMLAAGYAVYGVSTLLVLASAGGAAVYQVHLFSK